MAILYDVICGSDEIDANTIEERIMTEWAEADRKGDVVTAKCRLEFMIRYLSSLNVLLKLAPSHDEIEAIKRIFQQLKDLKELLRMADTQTVYAC